MAFNRPMKDRAPERTKNINVRLTYDEWVDIRKVAIAKDTSLTELIRTWIAHDKAEIIKTGKWPEEYNR